MPIIRMLAVAVVAAGLSVNAVADEASLDGVTWYYSVADGKATVTNASPAVGALSVPAQLAGRPVKAIGEGAFSACAGITAIELPAGLTEIRAAAFEDCTSLSTVTLSAGLTNIADNAFNRCSSLTTITIPAGVTAFGKDAFGSCTNLTARFLGPPPSGLGNGISEKATIIYTLMHAEA